MLKFIKDNKKKIVIVTIVIFLIFILFFLNYVIVHKNIPKGVNIKVIQNDIDVYDDIKISEIIKYNNIEVTNKDDFVNTSKVGTQKIKVYYKYKGLKYVYSFNLNIIDKKPPIIFSGTYKTILIGKNHDFCKSASYGDNYDRSPSCEVIGEYDVNKEGAYKLNLAITDSSGNVKTSKAILNVIEKFTSNKPQEIEKVEFSDVLSNYKNESSEVGIDVSKWQGDIDYSKVKKSGCNFVMIRIGVQSGKNKEIKLDKYFEKNYRNAKKAGLKVGIYVYSTAIKKETALKHAKWTIKKLKNKKIDLPIAYDWENWPYWKEYNMNFNDINEIANTFINALNKEGYDGILYSSKYYLDNIWENKNNYPVWLAHYTKSTSYKGNYMMWQLTNIGHIEGINGNVDINILYNK